jgi:hypothetical protein
MIDQQIKILRLQKRLKDFKTIITMNHIAKLLKENFDIQKEYKEYEFYKFMKSLMI